MKIEEESNKQIELLIERFKEFLKPKQEYRFYDNTHKMDKKTKMMKLKDGTQEPMSEHLTVVLDNEFQSFIVELFIHFFDLLWKEIDNPLFSFAERSMYDFITVWLFLYFQEDVSEKDKDRLKVILFVGHYKFIVASERELADYLSRRKQFLKEKDIKIIAEIESGPDYFKWLSTVMDGIKNKYKESQFQSFLNSKYQIKEILAHQHLHIHANPLSLNEMRSNHDRTARRKLLLCAYAMQVCEYFKKDDPQAFKKMEYIYNKLTMNLKYTLE